MLILAVEPDHRQAKQLTNLVRRHIRQAELIVADTGAKAVTAVETRIPDLILTPPLLPPKDEAVLTSWLRDLGDAAGHVQTLAIPILASNDGHRDRSMFGKGKASQHAQDQGCDPDVFAEQVRVYLERATNERATRIMSPTDDLEETITFDDLVIEEPNTDVEPAPVPVHEPPSSPTPAPVPVQRFEAPAPRVDPAVMREWETELGLESATPAPPLWRVNQNPAVTLAAVPSPEPQRQFRKHHSGFDASLPRYAPLLKRLDELAAHAD